MTRDLTSWTPRPRPDGRKLAGRTVRLERLDAFLHGDDLHAASSAPGAEERHRYLFESPPKDRDSYEGWLTRAAVSADPFYYVAIPAATRRPEGRLALMRIDTAHGVIEVGSILNGPRLARTVAATEAIYLLARHVFDDLGYRRFEWKCNDRNEPSKRAAQRFGFAHEGLFRRHMVVKGENRDTAWFAMVEDDWPGLKAAFEAWLDPSNFDESGLQRRRLEALRG